MSVRIYSTLYCPACVRAKMFFRERGIPYEEVDVTADAQARAWLREMTGRRTVPQIFIHGEAIGGFSDLMALARSGELDRKLTGPAAP